MLASAFARIPVTVPADDVYGPFVLEDQFEDAEYLLPKVIFYNMHSTKAVRLTIVHRLDLGVSADPLDDGVHDTTEVNNVSIAGGGRYVWTPNVAALAKSTNLPKVLHRVTLTNADLTDDVIVQIMVSGITEETAKTGLLSYRRIN